MKSSGMLSLAVLLALVLWGILILLPIAQRNVNLIMGFAAGIGIASFLAGRGPKSK